MSASLRGCYPGSFDPPTRAHLHIADAARRRFGLTTVTFVLSEVALAKEARVASGPTAVSRAEVVERIAARVEWLRVAVTTEQLIADLAEGYDVVVMGADKWVQVRDPAFYGGDPAARDEAIGRLPRIAVAPRGDHPVPEDLRLEVEPWAAEVSSTLARAGRRDLMLPEAVESGLWP